ncbi:hypothetical protein [Elizabethkingia anophelis]|uniref:hypothetical protein n=1 Tax=Elizabethkingia anophelis TaxID=1117645 RepID=UPI00038A2586|nr:hypothetical protein [Elizabethkingia anophelis]EQB92822.1 hypothetical protein C874_18070 [Elizabethkingia anophelis 502]
MSESTYIFKKFENTSYIDCTENLVSVTYIPLVHFKELEDSFTSHYTKFLIPQTVLTLLNDLLIRFEISAYKDELTSLMALSQDAYLTFTEIHSDSLIPDFIKEDTDYGTLLKVIEEYFFNNKVALSSISFKFSKTDVKTQTISHSNVTNHIIKALCNDLGIDKKNFYERQKEIIENSTMIKPDKGGDYARILIVQKLHSFLKSQTNNYSENQLLQFCGYFLHLCQIPYHQKEDEICLKHIKLKDFEPNILRNFIVRPNKVSTN